MKKKNIRYYMRNTNYYVDAYLRSIVDKELKKPRTKKKTNYFQELFKKRWGNFSKELFVKTVSAETKRGEELKELFKDKERLVDYLGQHERSLINELLDENMSSEDIGKLVTYLIKNISEKQKGGRRGVVKTRPVIFERVYSAFSDEQVPESISLQDVEKDFFARYRIAGIMEIYNRATYAIDDVMDRSQFRGGKPTLHKVFDEKKAIIAGQYLHTLSIRLLLEESEKAKLDKDITEKVLSALNRIHLSIYEKEIENYFLQEKLCQSKEVIMSRIENFDESIDYYLKRAALRCGIFYEEITDMAVLFATQDVARADSFKEYGLALGMRYMIDNDLKDLIDPSIIKKGTPSKGLKGVDFMGDLEIGKITYPVLVSLKRNPDPNIIDLIGRQMTYEEKESITRFVIDNGGVKATMNLLKSYAKKSKECLRREGITEPSLVEFSELWKFSDLPFKKFEEISSKRDT